MSSGVVWQSKSRSCAQLRVLAWSASFPGLSWAFVERLVGVVWAAMGVIWVSPGVLLPWPVSSFGSSWAFVGRLLGVMWVSCGVVWQSKCRSCTQLRPLPRPASLPGLSGRSLGAIWASMAVIRVPFGNPKVAVARNCEFCHGLRRSLASLGRSFGTFWAYCGRPWASFGCHLASFIQSTGLCRSLASLGRSLGASWASMAVARAHSVNLCML